MSHDVLPEVVPFEVRAVVVAAAGAWVEVAAVGVALDGALI